MHGCELMLSPVDDHRAVNFAAAHEFEQSLKSMACRLHPILKIKVMEAVSQIMEWS